MNLIAHNLGAMARLALLLRIALLLAGAQYLASALSACTDGGGQMTVVEWADELTFTESVAPLLGAYCGNPSCHGNTGRPFEVFAIRLHRLDSSRVLMNEPLTSEEADSNYIRALVFRRPAPDTLQSLLLTKPLAPSAGGVWHEGGVQFDDLDDSRLRPLVEWLQQQTAAEPEFP